MPLITTRFDATSNRITDELDKAGFPLPANCREVRLIIGLDGRPVFTFEVLATSEKLAAFGLALQAASTDKQL